MAVTKKILVATAVAALAGSAPALARPDHVPPRAERPARVDKPGRDNRPDQQARPRGRALGVYCQDQSKRHVPGTRGTPFSQCVTAMARLREDADETPRAACEDLSRKHVRGERGTPFSRCVVAGNELRRDQRAAAE